VLDKSTQGTPAKYSYCVAENEEDSPWAVRIRTVVEIFENSVRMHAGDEALVNLALAGLKQVEDIVNSEEFLQK